MRKAESVNNWKKRGHDITSGKGHTGCMVAESHSFNGKTRTPKVYHEVARNFGNKRFTNLLIKDNLISHFEKMFTEEEASVVRHLGYYPMGKTADSVARAERKSVQEVQEILDSLVNDRQLLISYGSDKNKRYAI